MAIDPSALYPGQVDVTDPNYSYGKPRNIVTEGDKTGTPLEQGWLRDFFGFKEAAMREGALTPSGTPDHRNDSQILEGLRAMVQGYLPLAYYVPLFNYGTTAASASEFELGAFDTNKGSNHLIQTTIGGTAVDIPLELPHARTKISASGIHVTLQGEGSHADLPSGLPSISLVSRAHNSETPTVVIDQFTDTAADAAAYDAVHTFTATNSELTLITNTQYALRLWGESGGNAVAGLKIFAIKLTLEYY